MNKLSSEKLKLLLDELKISLENKFDTNFEGLILFGSYAKGTANDNSDLDLLLVLNELPQSPIKKFDLIRDIIMNLENKYKININVISIKKSNLKLSPLLIDIAEYAKILADRNNAVKKFFEKIDKGYREKIFEKIVVGDHYMLKIENG